MKLALTIIQIVVSVALAGLILLQAKGVGLGRTMGPVAYHSKRGVENLVFRLTIILSCIFVALAVAVQFIS